MARWLGIVADPKSSEGGTTQEFLATGETKKAKIKKPAIWVPATTADMLIGASNTNRDDEVRGTRGNSPPVSFQASPTLTFASRAYPPLVREIARCAIGGKVTHNVAPSLPTTAAEDTVDIFDGEATAYLPTLIAWLLREEQLDRQTGVVMDSVEFNFPANAEGTINVTGQSLFMDVPQDWTKKSEIKDPGGELMETPETPSYTTMLETFSLISAVAKTEEGETELPNLSGFKLVFSQGLITDPISKFAANKNVYKKSLGTSGEKVSHKLWFPQRHKAGPQSITGTIDFSAQNISQAARTQLLHAEQLVFTIGAGLMSGVTGEPEELMKIKLFRKANTGGGAQPLAREGDQRSSFNFSGYIGSGAKDIAVKFTGETALPSNP